VIDRSLIARPTLREVVEQLAQQGLLPAEAGGAEGCRERVETSLRLGDAPSPWFVRGLVGMGAWVAGILFVSFLGLIQVLKHAGGTLTCATIFVVAALLLRRRAVGPFALQLALALSLGGEVLLVIGLSQDHALRPPGVMVALILLELLYLVLYRDVTRRFLSALTAPVTLMVLLLHQKVPHAYVVLTLWYALMAAYLWLEQAELSAGRLGRAHAPLALALTLVALGMLLGSLIVGTWQNDPEARQFTATGWPLTAALTLGTLALQARIAAENGASWTSPRLLLGMAGTLLLGAIGHGTPGLMGALATLLLAFHRRSPVLLAMAVLFLLTFSSAFYYNLGMTLLAKSGVLCLGGAVMLAGYAVLSRRPEQEPPAGGASR
jgi:hypothetical protein